MAHMLGPRRPCGTNLCDPLFLLHRLSLFTYLQHLFLKAKSSVIREKKTKLIRVNVQTSLFG